MKRFIKILGLLSFVSIFPLSTAWGLEGSTAFQGGFVQAFGGPSPLIASSGVNGFFYMDFKVIPGFYLGLSTSFSSLINGPDRLYVDGTHLFARVVPFASSEWTPYFMAGAGPRPFYDAQPNHRWLTGGDFQALAGAGLRHNLLPGMDLDLSVFYNLNTDTGDALSSAGLRAGLAFPFGGPEPQPAPTAKKTEQPEPIQVIEQTNPAPAPHPAKKTKRHRVTRKKHKPKAKEAESTAKPNFPYIVYSWVEGDQLESIAEAFLGHGNLYPLIVDANKMTLGSPRGLVTGVKLNIPDKPTDAQKEAAAAKSDSPEYMAWAKVGKTD